MLLTEDASFLSLDVLDNISILLDKDHDLEEEITHLFNPFTAKSQLLRIICRTFTGLQDLMYY